MTSRGTEFDSVTLDSKENAAFSMRFFHSAAMKGNERLLRFALSRMRIIFSQNLHKSKSGYVLNKYIA